MLRLKAVVLDGRLSDINAEANSGQFIHLLGSNGAGKSSLLAAVAGLVQVNKGRIEILRQGINEFSLAQLAQFRCLQEQQQNSTFAITVQESLSFFTGHSELPAELNHALEVDKFLLRPLGRLSGGESRRVHIARCLLQVWPAIAQGQALILLDEPVQGLDFRHQHLLCLLLQALAAKGNLILMSHHDLNLSQQYASHVWLMRNGRLIEQGERDDILQQKLLENAFECRVRILPDANNHKLFQTYLA